MTQAELAAAVEVATETISRLERGSATPSIERLEKIADALDVDLAELVARGREGQKERALARVGDILRPQKTETIDAIAEIVTRILARWK